MNPNKKIIPIKSAEAIPEVIPIEKSKKPTMRYIIQYALILLCVAFVMLIMAVRVGLTWGEGPVWIFIIIGGLLSGNYLPLPLWPDFMQRALMLQPFAGLMDIPFRLYIGAILPGDAIGAIGLQLLWAAAIVVLGKALLNRRISHLIVQGG